MRRSGQVSIEYMMVAVLLTVALVVVFAASFGIFDQQKVSLQVAQARSAANDLAEMTNFLCTAPRNTTQRTNVFIPSLTDLSQSSIGNNTIKFAIKTTEAQSFASASTVCNVTGTLPPRTGVFTFRGVSQGGSGGSVALNYTPDISGYRPSTG